MQNAKHIANNAFFTVPPLFLVQEMVVVVFLLIMGFHQTDATPLIIKLFGVICNKNMRKEGLYVTCSGNRYSFQFNCFSYFFWWVNHFAVYPGPACACVVLHTSAFQVVPALCHHRLYISCIGGRLFHNIKPQDLPRREMIPTLPLSVTQTCNEQCVSPHIFGHQ
jgi:hypothetical protein